ncbi:MAG: D-alanyl-D-alanine carboxypeptidase [Clostridiales bacterium]|nr:D-alanyl-D-alanine carboxypeptidase [Clostridiales bacterium]
MKKKFICTLLIITSLFLIIFQTKPVVFASDLNLDCKAYLLMDYNSNKIILKNNEEEHLEVASMVKLMTSLITIEKIESGELSLDQKVFVSEYAASQEGSQAFLDANKEYAIKDLLKSVIIASANDSSVALAETISGTEENFVKLMNEKAKMLDLKNTKYANSTGLPSDNEQYSCAKDIAKLLSEEIKHDLYFKYSKIWIDEIIHESGRRTELVNTNILTRQYQGCDIGKTGFTDEAGYCLSASSFKNNMRLVSVVIGAKTAKERFTLTTSLLNYGYTNYENKQILSKNDKIDALINIKGSKNRNLKFEYENDFYLLNKKGDNFDCDTKIELNKKLKAPIKAREIIGKCYIIKEGNVVGEVNIVASENIEKQTFKDGFKKILENFNI